MCESSTVGSLRMTEPKTHIPGWSDGDLRATADINFGLGSESDLEDPLRFLLGVARVIRRRQQEAGVRREDVPAIFFLEPYGPEAVDRAALNMKPMLDNGLTALGGSFWFVGPVVAQGFGLELADWSDDGKVFEKAVDELAVGDVPAVFFDARTDTPTLRHYPAGLENADDVAITSLGD